MKSRPFRVLIVDDEQEIYEIVSDEIKKTFSAETIHSVDGRNAMIQVGLHQPKIIVTDLNMPRGDGYEFVKRLRAISHNDDQSVIVLSGQSDVAIDELMDAGADYFISKPFHPDEIIDCVSNTLKSRRERWSQQPDEKMLKEMKKFNFSINPEQIGRRGFCVAESSAIKLNSIIYFKLTISEKIHFHGTGKVLWQRPAKGDSQPQCYGIEIDSIETSCLEKCVQFFESLNRTSSIPGGLQIFY